ncbi:MAG: cysteine desulfurase [Saprospiraceae bacterium]|nr:cysteine desulfurase [Saprospiraceae bacterium]
MQNIKSAFPIFSTYPHVYLDTAATAHKPQVVIDRIHHAYTQGYGSVQRGLYPLAARATQAFEDARTSVQHFINAEAHNQIIFTAGTTASINLVANGLAHLFERGFNIVISQMEHHANYIPWLELSNKTGAELRVIPLQKDGTLDLDRGLLMIDRLTKMVAVTQVSNVLGVVNPIDVIVPAARKMNALTLVDAAQSIGRMEIDVQALGCDFLVFSGHKLYGPTGIGVLFGRRAALQEIRPTAFGGGMVGQVNEGSFDMLSLPQRLEPGSKHLAGALGLQAAMDFMEELGLDMVYDHAKEITHYLTETLQASGVEVLAAAVPKLGCVSFTLDDVHPHDAATILGEHRICIRAGHHCAQPLHQALGVPSTMRASVGIYTDKEDIHKLVMGLNKVKRVFSS